jgi:hypothetical protein
VFGFATGVANGSEAVCFGATTVGSGYVHTQTTANGTTDLSIPLANVPGSPATSGTIQLTENTHFPAGITRLSMSLVFPIEVTSGTTDFFAITPALTMGVDGMENNQFSTLNLDSQILTVTASSRTMDLTWNFTIDLPNQYPIGTPPIVYDLQYDFNFSSTPGEFLVAGNVYVVVTGWEYGD